MTEDHSSPANADTELAIEIEQLIFKHVKVRELFDGGETFVGTSAAADAILAALRIRAQQTASPVSAVWDFAKAILHGDDEHRAWLLEAALAFQVGKPLPAPRGSGIRAQRAASPFPCPYNIDGCVLENSEIGPCLCAFTSPEWASGASSSGGSSHDAASIQPQRMPTAEDIYACCETTLIGFRDELTEQNIKFICDQVSRKAMMVYSHTRPERCEGGK